MTANLQIQKEKFKNSSEKQKNHYILFNMHKVGMRLICIHADVQTCLFQTKMPQGKKKILSISVSVQRTAQTSFRIFVQTRIIVDGAKFGSHHSGIFKIRLLKIATER